MSANPIFIGLVEPDKRTGELQFTPDDKELYAQHISGLDGHEVELVMRKRRSTRSLRQNRWFYSFIKPLAEHLGYEVEELKLVGLVAVFGTDVVMGYTVPKKAHTSQLNTEEFSDLCAWFVQRAAEVDFLILTPDEFKREKRKRERAHSEAGHRGRVSSGRSVSIAPRSQMTAPGEA